MYPLSFCVQTHTRLSISSKNHRTPPNLVNIASLNLSGANFFGVKIAVLNLEDIEIKNWRHQYNCKESLLIDRANNYLLEIHISLFSTELTVIKTLLKHLGFSLRQVNNLEFFFPQILMPVAQIDFMIGDCIQGMFLNTRKGFRSLGQLSNGNALCNFTFSFFPP